MRVEAVSCSGRQYRGSHYGLCLGNWCTSFVQLILALQDFVMATQSRVMAQQAQQILVVTTAVLKYMQSTSRIRRNSIYHGKTY